MKNNPLIPFVLIMAFGIGLIFFMSVGSGGQKEHAEGGETTETNETVDVSSCVSCHGGDLTGAVGPSLIGLDQEHIVDVLVNGLEGSNFMKPGMKSEAEAKAIAEHIATLE